MPIREYKPDQFFRASIDLMDDIEDCKTYVVEYFSWKVPRHGEAVFMNLEDAEKFLLEVYSEDTPDLPAAERELRITMCNQLHLKSAKAHGRGGTAFRASVSAR